MLEAIKLDNFQEVNGIDLIPTQIKAKTKNIITYQNINFDLFSSEELDKNIDFYNKNKIILPITIKRKLVFIILEKIGKVYMSLDYSNKNINIKNILIDFFVEYKNDKIIQNNLKIIFKKIEPYIYNMENILTNEYVKLIKMFPEKYNKTNVNLIHKNILKNKSVDINTKIIRLKGLKSRIEDLNNISFKDIIIKKLEKKELKKDINIKELKVLLDKINKALIYKDNSNIEKIYNIIFDRIDELSSSDKDIKIIVKILIKFLDGICTGVFNYEEVLDKIIINDENLKSYIYKTPEIMSNIDGKIKSITFYLGGNGSRDELYDIIKQLLIIKKSQNDFCIKCVYFKESEKKNLLNYINGTGIMDISKLWFLNPNNIDDYNKLSIWSRDGAVIMDDNTIVLPNNKRVENLEAYSSLHPFTNKKIKKSKLFFEGGNLRATSKYLFIGTEDILENITLKKTGKSFSELKNKIDFIPKITQTDIDDFIFAFEKEFGKKVVVVGKFPFQDVFHIDMGLTVLDDKTLLIGEGLFQENYDDLKKLGFDIHQLPYKVFGGAYYTYNNALIEKYEENGKLVKRVFLPQYYYASGFDVKNRWYEMYYGEKDDKVFDLGKMNLEAKQMYEKLGFEVVGIDVCETIIKCKGSLNCLTFEER